VSLAGPIRYVVRGRVQGVGFRWFVLREATRLQLTGFVANLPDGTVEVQACGAVAALESLHARLAQGPAGAHVTDVEKQDLSHQGGKFKSFEIR
jgi:acylphosphatase